MATVLTGPGAAERVSQPTRKRGFFARAVAAVVKARQEQADRQVAELLADRGGALSDVLGRRLQPVSQRRYPFRDPT